MKTLMRWTQTISKFDEQLYIETQQNVNSPHHNMSGEEAEKLAEIYFNGCKGN